jgi:hypothetical protein
MRRMFVIAAIVMVQLGLMFGWSGLASANTVLSGGPPSGCTQAGASQVDLVQGLTAAGSGANLKVQLEVVINCTSYSTVSPTVTSLSGVLKATLHLTTSATGGPRKCTNFESSTTPNDVVSSGTGYIQWFAGGISGSVAKTKFTYGTATSYVEDSSGSLEMDVTSNTTVGSFAGNTVNAVVPTSTTYNSCPQAAGSIAASGSTITL